MALSSFHILLTKKAVPFDTWERTQTSGQNAFIKNSKGTAFRAAILSVLSSRPAIVFGIISPKTVTKKVIAAVAIATPLLPTNSIASAVAIAEASVLMKFIPTRTIVKRPSMSL